MVAVYTERAFEEAVAEHLVASGYLHGDPADFDPEIAIDTVQLFARFQESPGFKRLVKEHIRPRVYGRQRSGSG